MNYWYLSFADDTGNLGVCVVQAECMKGAILLTHMLGINPGGEVWGLCIPHDRVDEAVIAWDFRQHINKLLTLGDLERMGAEPVSPLTGERMRVQ